MESEHVTILATADLHYDIARSRPAVESLARRVCDTPADALVLVGDTAGAELSAMVDCLNLFAGFPGQKLLVPGNHCLWCAGGSSGLAASVSPGPDDGNAESLTRYYHTLGEQAERAGFVVLDHNPRVIGGVGLVGSVGWYDYSLRDRALGVPLAFYRAKVAPGAAAYYSEYQHLIDAHRDELTDEHLAIRTMWMDGQRVSLGMTDEQFTDRLVERLSAQLAELAARAERIVAFLHHLPFAELVPPDRSPKWAFAAAFLGSERFGQALAAEPKVSHVLCGHSHWPMRRKIGSIEVINIGSTYADKRLEVLRLP